MPIATCSVLLLCTTGKRQTLVIKSVSFWLTETTDGWPYMTNGRCFYEIMFVFISAPLFSIHMLSSSFSNREGSMWSHCKIHTVHANRRTKQQWWSVSSTGWCNDAITHFRTGTCDSGKMKVTTIKKESYINTLNRPNVIKRGFVYTRQLLICSRKHSISSSGKDTKANVHWNILCLCQFSQMYFPCAEDRRRSTSGWTTDKRRQCSYTTYRLSDLNTHMSSCFTSSNTTAEFMDMNPLY